MSGSKASQQKPKVFCWRKKKKTQFLLWFEFFLQCLPLTPANRVNEREQSSMSYGKHYPPPPLSTLSSIAPQSSLVDQVLSLFQNCSNYSTQPHIQENTMSMLQYFLWDQTASTNWVLATAQLEHPKRCPDKAKTSSSKTECLRAAQPPFLACLYKLDINFKENTVKNNEEIIFL